MEPVILADAVNARAAEIEVAAKAAGLDDAQVAAVVNAYRERAVAPKTVIICGNVRKSEPHYACTLPPHPDEPGNRQQHSYTDAQGRVHTWAGPLTLPEQMEAESGPKCGSRSKEHGNHVCVRTKHDPEKTPHAAWTKFQPDPAVGPQKSDPDRVLTTW